MDIRSDRERTGSYNDDHDSSEHPYKNMRLTAVQRTDEQCYARPRALSSPRSTHTSMPAELGPRIYDPVGGTWTRKPLRLPSQTAASVENRQQPRTVVDHSQSPSDGLQIVHSARLDQDRKRGREGPFYDLSRYDSKRIRTSTPFMGNGRSPSGGTGALVIDLTLDSPEILSPAPRASDEKIVSFLGTGWDSDYGTQPQIKQEQQTCGTPPPGDWKQYPSSEGGYRRQDNTPSLSSPLEKHRMATTDISTTSREVRASPPPSPTRESGYTATSSTQPYYRSSIMSYDDKGKPDRNDILKSSKQDTDVVRRCTASSTDKRNIREGNNQPLVGRELPTLEGPQPKNTAARSLHNPAGRNGKQSADPSRTRYGPFLEDSDSDGDVSPPSARRVRETTSPLFEPLCTTAESFDGLKSSHSNSESNSNEIENKNPEVQSNSSNSDFLLGSAKPEIQPKKPKPWHTEQGKNEYSSSRAPTDTLCKKLGFGSSLLQKKPLNTAPALGVESERLPPRDEPRNKDIRSHVVAHKPRPLMAIGGTSQIPESMEKRLSKPFEKVRELTTTVARATKEVDPIQPTALLAEKAEASVAQTAIPSNVLESESATSLEPIQKPDPPSHIHVNSENVASTKNDRIPTSIAPSVAYPKAKPAESLETTPTKPNSAQKGCHDLNLPSAKGFLDHNPSPQRSQGSYTHAIPGKNDDTMAGAAASRIPESLRYDRPPAVSEQARAIHLQAGTSRNNSAHATKQGFSFEVPKENDKAHKNASLYNLQDMPSFNHLRSTGPSCPSEAGGSTPQDTASSQELDYIILGKPSDPQFDDVVLSRGRQMTIGDWVLQAAERMPHAKAIMEGVRALLRESGRPGGMNQKRIRAFVMRRTGRDVPLCLDKKSNAHKKSAISIRAQSALNKDEEVAAAKQNIDLSLDNSAPPPKSDKSQRPQYSGKTVVLDWKTRMRLHGSLESQHCDSDDEEDSVLATSDLDRADTEEDDGEDEGLTRPFHVYTVYKVVYPGNMEEEEAESFEEEPYEVGGYLDVQEANSIAYQAVRVNLSLQGSIHWQAESDYRMIYQHKTPYFTIKTWVEKTIKHEPGVPQPPPSTRRLPLRVYEVHEEVSAAPPAPSAAAPHASSPNAPGDSSAEAPSSDAAIDALFEDTDTPSQPEVVVADRVVDMAVYSTVQQANAAAVAYLLEHVVGANKPRWTNLNRVDLWFAEQTQVLRALQKTCDRLDEPLSEVRAVQVKGEGWRLEERIWKVEVVAREVMGPLN